MKYLYILLGLIGIGLAIFVSWYWINYGFLYTLRHLFAPGQSFVSRSVVALFIAFWLHGITYLYYGVKSHKINSWTNSTMIVLIIMLIAGFIAAVLGACPAGGACPDIWISDRDIYTVGLFLSSILLIISFFKKPRVEQSG